MNVLTLMATLGIDTTEYETGLQNASSDANSFGQQTGKTLSAFAKKASKLLAIGAVAKFTKSVVDTGSQFDKSMSQVAATMGVTVDNIGDLRSFAMKMGQTTSFSATEAADALNYMALAGYDAETSMKMLPTVLNLAAAGGIDLAYASDMVTDAQSALGLSIEETEIMVDQMARTSSKSNTSVAQLGEAILSVGATARGIRGGTTELATVLGVLADNGIKGAEGGTHLRNALISLQTPTKSGTEALERLGLTYNDFYDSVGNMRSLPEIFAQLSESMEGMTQQDRDSIVGGLFNKFDLAAMNALLGTSSERWEQLTTSIEGSWYTVGSLTDSLSEAGLDFNIIQKNLNKLGISAEDFGDILNWSGGDVESFVEYLYEAAEAGVTYEQLIEALGGDLETLQKAFDGTAGAAENMAETQLDNLAGDLTLLDSALESVKINLSTALEPALRVLAQTGTNVLSQLSDYLSSDQGVETLTKMGDALAQLVQTLLTPENVETGLQLMTAGIEALSNALQWLVDHKEAVLTAIEGIIGLFASSKISGFVNSITGGGGGSIVGTVVKNILGGGGGAAPAATFAGAGLGTKLLPFAGKAAAAAGPWAGLALVSAAGSYAIDKAGIERSRGKEWTDKYDTEEYYAAMDEADNQHVARMQNTLERLDKVQALEEDKDATEADRLEEAKQVLSELGSTIEEFLPDLESIQKFKENYSEYNGENGFDWSSAMESDQIHGDQIIELATTAYDALIEKINELKESGGAVGEEVKTSLTGAADGLETEVSEGLANGGEAGGSSVETSLTEHGSTAVDAIQQMLSGLVFPEFTANGTATTKTTKRKRHASAMSNGEILNELTPFGIDSHGVVHYGGEAGAEAVVGVNSLDHMIQESVRNAIGAVLGKMDQLIGGQDQGDVKIVLNNGALVGQMVKEMDRQLGSTARRRGGGRT